MKRPSGDISHRVEGHNAAAINYGHIGDVVLSAWRPLRLAEAQSNREDVLRDLDPRRAGDLTWFAHRPRPLATIDDAIRAGGRTVVIEGDSGTGKTAILAA